MANAITLRNLQKKFSNSVALDDVSLEAASGELTVLLGPSGCGKSTLLRLVAGLDFPTKGEIDLGAQRIDTLPPSARNIAMVFQNYALFPHLSVADNILFGLQVRRVPRSERAAKLEEVASLLSLDALLSRKPSQLSGGQQQRVALGRAIISGRQIVLMDEPLSNLDAKLRAQMRVEIRALQQRLGLTMLYVTHDQVEAITMADRVVLLHEGRVSQIGTPQDLYERPANSFVAQFIGAPPMNLFAFATLRAALPETSLPDLPDDLLVGLRPEDITLAEAGAGLAAQVEHTEYHGADRLVSARAGKDLLNLRLSPRVLLPADGQIALNWRPEAVHLFDPRTGDRQENLTPPVPPSTKWRT